MKKTQKTRGKVYQVSFKVENVGKDLEKFGVEAGKPFPVRFKRSITGVNILGVNCIKAPKLHFFNSKFRRSVKESIGKKAKLLPKGTVMWKKNPSGDMGDTEVRNKNHTILYCAAAISVALILLNSHSKER